MRRRAPAIRNASGRYPHWAATAWAALLVLDLLVPGSSGEDTGRIGWREELECQRGRLGQARKWAPAGDERRAGRTAWQERSHLSLVQGVVEDDQRPRPGQPAAVGPGGCIKGRGELLAGDAQGPKELVNDHERVESFAPLTTQIGEQLRVRKLLADLMGEVDGESGLTDTRRPVDGENRPIGALGADQAGAQLGQLISASGEVGNVMR